MSDLASKLRHRVKIQSTTEASDGAGGIIKTFTTDATVHAAIGPLRGREALEAQAVNSVITHKIILRHYRGLTTDHKLVYRDHDTNSDRTFEIESIRNIDERNRELEVMVKESV